MGGGLPCLPSSPPSRQSKTMSPFKEPGKEAAGQRARLPLEGHRAMFFPGSYGSWHQAESQRWDQSGGVLCAPFKPRSPGSNGPRDLPALLAASLAPAES